MFSDAGPDVRWVGNEKGIAGDPCWSTINVDLLFPGIDEESFRSRLTTDLTADMVAAWGSPMEMLNAGDRHGDTWLPAECDVSIRPGWFYHAAEDARVRTPENLVDLYFHSVGRGASLLLNLPPDRRGQIHENDVQSLRGFRQRLDEIFAQDLARQAQCTASNTRGQSPQFDPNHVIDGDPESYWATDDEIQTPELILEFAQPVTFNVVSLREYLPLGQCVDRFAVDFDDGGSWREWCSAAAIGARRLMRGQAATTSRVRLRIVESPVCPAISEWGLFHALT
jgi:alpha-L-fucosidase